MTEPLLELQGLHKAFGALQATDGVDLTVRPGEIHALIGPNGAGQSTLIAQIAGGLAPDAGRIVLLGEDVTGWPVARRARLRSAARRVGKECVRTCRSRWSAHH